MSETDNKKVDPRDLQEKLKEVGLKKQGYWDARYFKNVDKLSKPLYEMKQEKDVYVAVRDGTRLCLDVFRPDAPGKFPALISVAGYSKDHQSMHLSTKMPPQDFRSIIFDHSIEAGSIDFLRKKRLRAGYPGHTGVGNRKAHFTGYTARTSRKTPTISSNGSRSSRGVTGTWA